MKSALRSFDRRYAGGRVARAYQRHFVLGGGWGEFLARIGDVAPGTTILDLGAGEAEFRSRFPRSRYIAIDRGIGHGGWDYSKLDVVADATAVPLRGGSCDLIVCKQVLEHIPDPARLMAEARRVLKPGGRLLLSTNQAWPQHQQPYDFFRFTSFGLRRLSEDAGLEVERLEAMGGAFTAALFHFTQTLAPHLWARTPSGRRTVEIVTKPLAVLVRLLAPIANALDRRDRSKDNTLGWFVSARVPE